MLSIDHQPINITLVVNHTLMAHRITLKQRRIVDEECKLDW